MWRRILSSAPFCWAAGKRRRKSCCRRMAPSSTLPERSTFRSRHRVISLLPPPTSTRAKRPSRSFSFSKTPRAIRRASSWPEITRTSMPVRRRTRSTKRALSDASRRALVPKATTLSTRRSSQVCRKLLNAKRALCTAPRASFPV